MQYSRLTINPSFDEYIPDGVSNRINLRKIDSIFGGREKIMVILEDDNTILNTAGMERIDRLAEAFKEIPGIERCLTVRDALDIRYENGITSMDPVVEEIPQDTEQLDSLKKKILANSMARRFLSDDFTAAAIILTKANDISDEEIISSVQQVIKENPGPQRTYIGGLAYIRYTIRKDIRKDLMRLLPAGLLLMLLMLYLSFRDWKGVILPFVVVILSIVYAFGLMALLGWEIALITVLLPIILIAVANDYGIHLINLYQEKVGSGRYTDMKQLAASLYQDLKKPILITGLTTMGGLLGLLSHKLRPAAQLGILSAAGIAFALLLSLYLIPVLLSYTRYPEKIRVRNESSSSFIQRILSLFSRWTTLHPKRVVGVFLIITLAGAGGFFLLKINTNTEEYFGKKSGIRKGIDLINCKFGGSQYVSILFRGDVLSPEMLRRMDRYTREIAALPEAGQVISPSAFLRELSKGLYPPDDPHYGTLPATEAAAIQYLELFSWSGYSDQVAQFIDLNNTHARLLVSLKDGSNETGKSLLSSLRRITAGDPQLVCIAGAGLSKIQIADMLVGGQISSLLLAFAIIFLLITLIFRSVVAGLQSALPLVVSIVLLFGLMGYGGIPLDIVNTLLSSIMIGVGVDYTIHFLWRYRSEYAITHNTAQAITRTMHTTGRGIIFNALSVITGFSVLILSGFAPLRFFGLLVVVSIFVCLISALLLIPALITLTRPRYLETAIKQEKS